MVKMNFTHRYATTVCRLQETFAVFTEKPSRGTVLRSSVVLQPSNRAGCYSISLISWFFGRNRYPTPRIDSSGYHHHYWSDEERYIDISVSSVERD